MSEVPAISIDRAARHYFDDIEIDTQKLAERYVAIPIADKPSLANCHIHLSAIASFKINRPVTGRSFSNKENTRLFDSLSPPADVVIYLGSLLLSKNRTPAETLVHELTHYAQSGTQHSGVSSIKEEPDAKSSADEDLLLRGKLAMLTSPRLRALGITSSVAANTCCVIAAESLVGDATSTPYRLLSGAGLAFGMRLLRQPKRKERISNIQQKIYDNYREDPNEVEAWDQTDVDESMFRVIQKEPLPDIIARGIGKTDRLWDYVHRSYNLTSISPKMPKNTL